MSNKQTCQSLAWPLFFPVSV